MFEFADILFEKRRPIIVSVAVISVILIICILAPIVHAAAPDTTASTSAPYGGQVSQGSYDSANVVTNGLSQAADQVNYSVNTAGDRALESVMTMAAGITSFDHAVVNGARTAVVSTVRGIGSGISATGRGIAGAFIFTGHAFTNVSSVIQPSNDTDVPVITKQQAEQAELIQSGTTDVIMAASMGDGGACDNGNGNGAYPAVWCNAPMDSLPTVSYNNDRINRECTSYAHWYFTNVEGHTDFHASGDAKNWAYTTNYPTHGTPRIGAIAVEAAGAYGHVAIVHALPGQIYNGRVVPAGYILVSEMNYDWQGHFRYSYSSLSKFSAYIYP